MRVETHKKNPGGNSRGSQQVAAHRRGSGVLWLLPTKFPVGAHLHNAFALTDVNGLRRTSNRSETDCFGTEVIEIIFEKHGKVADDGIFRSRLPPSNHCESRSPLRMSCYQERGYRICRVSTRRRLSRK